MLDHFKFGRLAALCFVHILLGQAALAQSLNHKINFHVSDDVVISDVSTSPHYHQYLIASNSPFALVAKSRFYPIYASITSQGRNLLIFGENANRMDARYVCRSPGRDKKVLVLLTDQRTARAPGSLRSQSVQLRIEHRPGSEPQFWIDSVKKIQMAHPDAVSSCTPFN